MPFEPSKSVLMLEAITKIRDENTEPSQFRYYLERIGRYLAYEISKELEVENFEVNTPLERTIGHKIKDDIVILSILRAAIPLSNGVLSEFSDATLGLISASRGDMIDSDGKSFQIESSYLKLPSLSDKVVMIVDPMLATGSTIKFLLEIINKGTETPHSIIVICAIASKYGIESLEKAYPNLKIYAAAIDENLNKKGYIVPGLGDAGDRAFNTPH